MSKSDYGTRQTTLVKWAAKFADYLDVVLNDGSAPKTGDQLYHDFCVKNRTAYGLETDLRHYLWQQGVL